MIALQMFAASWGSALMVIGVDDIVQGRDLGESVARAVLGAWHALVLSHRLSRDVT